jgi:hypothetical protein
MYVRIRTLKRTLMKNYKVLACIPLPLPPLASTLPKTLAGIFQNKKWAISDFIFRRMVVNKITKFRMFSLLRNGSEQNSEIFIFCGMAQKKIWRVF